MPPQPQPPPALLSLGPSRKHISLNRCACMCVRVRIFRLQVPGEPVTQNNRARGKGLGLLPHRGPEKGLETELHFQLPRLCSSSTSASPVPPRLPSSSLATRRLWIPPAGGGREGHREPERPGAAAAQPSSQAHGRPQCGVPPEEHACCGASAQETSSTHPPHLPRGPREVLQK